VALTQLDPQDYAREAGFEFLSDAQDLDQVLKTSRPFVRIRDTLVACEVESDGSIVLVTDDACPQFRWAELSETERSTILGLLEQEKCGCSMCEALV
jgi:hypothetical protein